MSLYHTILTFIVLPPLLVGCISKKENLILPSTTPPPAVSSNLPSPRSDHSPTASATIFFSTPIPTLPQSNDQVTSTPTQRKIKITDPGIYPVFWDYSQSRLFIDSGNENHENLIKMTISDQQAKPSPSGERIAFVNKNFLYTIDLKNDQIDKIPQPEHGSVDNWWSGSWSPDGKYLAYAIRTAQIKNDTAIIDDYPNIYIADLVNNRFIQITSWNTLETAPIWSPDGQWLAFLSDHAKPNIASGSIGGGADIFLMNTSCLYKFVTCQSPALKQLTNTGVDGNVESESWSPDGKSIAYVYALKFNADHDLYLINIDGRTTNITRSLEVNEDAFDWSPFGDNLIIRKSTLDGTDLFLFSLQQNSYKKITNSAETAEGDPYWSPDGKYIAFTQDTSGLAEKSIDAYSINTEKVFQIGPSDDKDYGFAFWMTVLPPMQIGTVLQVSPIGAKLNLRRGPSITSSVVEQLAPGDKLKIIDGPKFSQEYTWWKVEVNTLQGWVSQAPLWYLPVNNSSFEK